MMHPPFYPWLNGKLRNLKILEYSPMITGPFFPVSSPFNPSMGAYSQMKGPSIMGDKDKLASFKEKDFHYPSREMMNSPFLLGPPSSFLHQKKPSKEENDDQSQNLNPKQRLLA